MAARLPSFSPQHTCKKLVRKILCQCFSKSMKREVTLLIEWPIFCLAFNSAGTKVNSNLPFITRHVHILPTQHGPYKKP